PGRRRPPFAVREMIPFNSAVADEVRSLVQGADGSTVDSIYRELCQV
uniref:Uncharacterized protein n=1 Tax=Aegilops tauschii subsp. strangulata TaxID=200361 RepID=A0A452YUI2_AEGTS